MKKHFTLFSLPRLGSCIKGSTGFSLVELLGVVGIIGILMGLVGGAAYSARQRAYVATATTEAQQICAAIKSYWNAYRRFPSFSGTSEDGYTLLTESNMRELLGNGNNAALINIPPDRFEGESREFCDPWGNAYRVKLERPSGVSAENVFEGVVSFPTQYRYFCEDGIYESSFKWDERTWEP